MRGLPPGLPPLLAALFLIGSIQPARAAIDLADAPLFSSVTVPGNLALALSVEYPTATTPAYTTAYSANQVFLGYFDPEKCYRYVYDSFTPSASYFDPHGPAGNRACATGSAGLQLWSGNYLNWASMQTLDTFRWVLTGGYRSVDTPTETRLTKTYAWHDGLNPDKTLQGGVSGVTPFSWSRARTRVRALGTAIYITNNGSLTSASVADYTSEFGSPNPQTVYRLYINVRVCASAALLEDNCVRYGNHYKPEGLMQQYADKLRYAAFGYYNDSSGTRQRDGGILRARMKFIAPTQPVPGSPSVGNAASEWDPDTGVMVVNPDPADAAATVADAADDGVSVSINQSGVMNYLNQFGYTARSYKTNDPVSELYYAATRYFRNKGNVEAYSSLRGASSEAASNYLDGFPAIRRWDDPVLYSCQKNFILGIGDVYAHRDASVPGSGLTSSQEGGTLATVNADDLSATLANDDTADGLMKSVAHSTNMIGQMEGFSGSFATQWNKCSGSRGNTNFIAGMAYDMHVRDIRPDLGGMQTLNTYWMDVQENSNYCHKNQFWLAAKYGGFTLPAGGFSPYSANNSPATLSADSWASGDVLPLSGTKFQASYSFSTDTGETDPRPANYFPGNSPQTMKTGLTEAFARIAAEATAATATALSSPSPKQAANGAANYAASYDPSGWTSSLKGQSVSYGSDGEPVLSDVWSADALLNARNWNTRQIISYCNGGIPLSAAASCSASFGAVDGVSTQSAANFVRYLRGDRSQELANGGAYRTRISLLGDVVGAKLVANGPPALPLGELKNAGYSDFKRRHAQRETVVFVGSNNGMLHAFNGSITSRDGGKELFAYIPGLIYSDTDPNTAGGLSSLGNPLFTHRYLVDATPNVFDIDFRRAGTPDSAGTASDWRSVLIGGLGKGGRGYYAIDVTDPAGWTSEAEVAGKVLWEFSAGNDRMGFSYGDALVVKTAKYGWVAVLTSGYNNDDGKGYFFFVNPRTGSLLETVATPEGSAGAPLNLAKASAYVPDYRDGTADAIYAGDLQGNLWRLDLTAASGFYPAPTRIAQLRNANGVAQPVTTRPLIEIEPHSSRRYVLIGSGRLLADSDVTSANTQSFYAIHDGKSGAGAFHGGSTSLPRGVSFPLTRDELQENRVLTSGITGNPAAGMGWYFDMKVTRNIAERVSVDLVANNGVVAWAGNLPNGDACSPAGTSDIYAVSIGSGKSVLHDAAGASLVSFAQNSVVTDLSFVSVNGVIRLLAGTASGSVAKVPGNYAFSNALKRRNWRVVPAVE